MPEDFPSWYHTGSLDTLSLALYKTVHPAPDPVDTSTLSFIPFFGPPGSYSAMSLSAVLALSRVDLLATFGGKYVLIGESGSFIHDAQISPVTGTLMDGVESHAHFLDGLLQGRQLTSWDIGNLSAFISFIVLIILSVSLYTLIPKYS